MTERLIHPVKHDGKGFIPFRVPKNKIHGWAGYDSMEVKYDKQENTFSLKIKSFMARTGCPDLAHAQWLVASSNGEVDVI